MCKELNFRIKNDNCGAWYKFSALNASGRLVFNLNLIEPSDAEIWQ
jgi:hypothetical protein